MDLRERDEWFVAYLDYRRWLYRIGTVSVLLAVTGLLLALLATDAWLYAVALILILWLGAVQVLLPLSRSAQLRTPRHDGLQVRPTVLYWKVSRIWQQYLGLSLAIAGAASVATIAFAVLSWSAVWIAGTLVVQAGAVSAFCGRQAYANSLSALRSRADGL
jgi:hypothetical protein